ncbi:MAG: DUF2231 domain-containing protein [Planctomycetota bacterium]|jgi:uncharacterized membrane protein
MPEVLGTIAILPAAAPTGPWDDPAAWRFMGRLHPLVVHFPVALVLLAALLESVLVFRPSHRVSRTAVTCLAFGAVAAAAAAWFGWLNAAHEPRGAASDLMVFLHRWTGVGAAAVAWLALVLVCVDARRRVHWALSGYRAALLVAAALVAVGGHFGGVLVRGEGYLLAVLRTPATTPAPPPAPMMTDAAPPPPVPGPVAATPPAPTDVAIDFARDVRPILVERCAHCHGPDRRKGRLALEPVAEAFAGDPAGWVIRPGDPAASPLVQRVRLPAGHPDGMPADGDPLPAAAIERLERWIAQGAAYDAAAPPTVAAGPPDAPAPAAAEPTDATPDPPSVSAPVATPTPAAPDAAQRAARAGAADRVHARGGIVTPVAAGADELDVNLALADPPVADADLDLLDDLGPWVVHLSLARSAVSDDGLARLARLPALRRLRLDGTPVAGPGLRHLAGLAALADLNLAGTRVSDDAAEAIAALPGLRRVYVWRTAMTDAGRARLAALRPDVEIVAGETLPRDSHAGGHR